MATNNQDENAWIPVTPKKRRTQGHVQHDLEPTRLFPGSSSIPMAANNRNDIDLAPVTPTKRRTQGHVQHDIAPTRLFPGSPSITMASNNRNGIAWTPVTPQKRRKHLQHDLAPKKLFPDSSSIPMATNNRNGIFWTPVTPKKRREHTPTTAIEVKFSTATSPKRAVKQNDISKENNHKTTGFVKTEIDFPELGTDFTATRNCTPINSMSYKDVLQKISVNNFVEQSRDGSKEEAPTQSCKTPKLKSKVKQNIDQMIKDVGGAFLFVCKKCFNNRPQRMSAKKSKGNCCDSLDRHMWNESNKVMVHRSPNRKYPLLIRTRPPELQLSLRIKMCPFVHGCKYAQKCRCAHNRLEIKVWNLGTVSHDEIVKQCCVDKPPTGFWCSYCNCIFQVKWELENHTNSSEHREKLTLDKERPWQHREPPDNIISGNYTLCPSVNNSGCCMFSKASTADNACPKAHSTAELEEWQERHQYRQMKLLRAKQHNLFSFMDAIQTEYASTDSEIDVISEHEPAGVKIAVDKGLTQYIQSPLAGSYQCKWSFSVIASKQVNLLRVGLLHDGYRVHFHLSSPKNMQEPQVCPGDKIYQPHTKGSQYHIDVLFKSKMIGRYKQWVIFDFGSKPVVKRELLIDTGVDDPGDDLPSELNQPPFAQIWDGTNTKIVPYLKDRIGDEMKALETKYKVTDFQVELGKGVGTLTRENYKSNMDQLLRMEEKARQEKLSTFCIETTMEIHPRVTIQSATDSKYIIAQGGQLFGQIDITQSSIDDSDASQIALTSVQYVLIKFPKASKVYEAQIVMDDADGRTKDAIYVRLSEDCVCDLKLCETKKSKVQIQFRLNRFHFCVMRWALDNLKSTTILFPTKNEHPALLHSVSQTPDSGSQFNRLQEGAVRFLIEKGGRNSKTPVLLLYGPFGTGKTYTIANGVMKALMDTDMRILICTHTNSAADLYITDYFDTFAQNWSSDEFDMDMLRVYATDRDVRTIPKKIHKYMLFTRQGNIKKLEEWDVRGKRLVITTTSSAVQLAALNLRGYFTHILIDEAAQVMETEAIIPMILSLPDTCVVLAGDHIQMGPKVYSKEARDVKFHHSILERMFDHCLKNRCHRHILLTSNYRTHETILAFLSKVFYSAEDIEACGNQPRHPIYYPLEFRAVQGYDMMIGNSYVNRYEIKETVNRVQEILDNWPEQEWGPKRQEDIGVFAPYRLQVQQMRREFRKKGLHNVFVDSLQGVQGKQFRVVVISTVRTRKTIDRKDSNTEYYLGFLSDMRQLNTAFTRSQSLVVVVGNPIALCSIGDCCNAWKKYIKECEREGSLYPQGTAFSDIRLAISAATTTLNPKAVSFTPQGFAQPVDCSENMMGNVREQNIQIKHESVEDSESDDEIDFNVDDVILKALRRQLLNDRRRQNGEDELTSDDDDTGDELLTFSADNIRMIEEDDHVRLVKDEEDNNKIGQFNGTKLDTDKLVSSVFHMSLDGRCCATPKDTFDHVAEITIANMSQRNTAMDGDQVTVEILQNDEQKGQGEKAENKDKVYGKVVNIDERAVDYTDKKLICLVDPFSDNLMVPVNRRLPKIMMVNPNRNRNQTKRKRTSGHLVIPICRLTKHGVQRKRDVVVSNKDRPHKLFQVQWRYWKKGHNYPLGVVTAELPSGDNQIDGLKLLKQIYEVNPHDDSLELLQMFQPDWSIPQEEYRKRKDLRNLLVFTIDPQGSEDLDDALSVQQLQDDRYVVGVHIADVSYFVKPGTTVDTKAREAATSFYPAGAKPVHMLPPRLSTDLCSLKPGHEKLAISVFLVFNEAGQHLPLESTIDRTIIHSHVQLTYDDAEKIISDESYYHPEIESSLFRPYLQTLSCLACGCRKERLGNAAFSQLGSSPDVLSHPRAHILVEEMMILANETVGRRLVTKLPQCTPLRRQLPPLLDKFREWKKEHSESIEESLHLTHITETSNSVLKDDSQCSNDDHMVQVNVLRKIWEAMKECFANDPIDNFRFAGLVCTDQNHPQLAATQTALHKILSHGEYISSGSYPADEHRHSSLVKATYTHFTSPIRRYIDIVVHRLIVAVLNKSKTIPHDGKDVAQICHNCNIRSFAANEFEMKSHALQTALSLKDHPIFTTGFIEVLTDKNIQLGFRHDDRVKEGLKKSSVGFSVLKPFVKPELEDDKVAVMKWKERVYNVNGMPRLKANDIRANQSKRANLQVDMSDRCRLEIPVHNWRCINTAIAEQNWGEAAEAFMRYKCTKSETKEQERRSEDTQTITVEDITCETDSDAKKKKDYVQFEHTFRVGNVAEVQLYPVFNRGLLSPAVQLYKMTPTLDFCIEHRSQPVKCLSTVADHVPKRYDIEIYQKTWLPLVDMMSAYNAVQQNETVVIHGVRIDWRQHSSEPLPAGSFTLTKKFCKDRHIEISDFNPNEIKQAYLCIRYTKRPKVESEAKDEEQEEPTTFVAHAFTLDVEATDEKDPEKVELNIFFEVNQMSAPFPKTLRRSERQPEECTVEMIPVCFPDSRLEAAVKKVNSSSSLVKNICLLSPGKAEYDQDSDKLDMDILTSAADKKTTLVVPGCRLNALNRPQKEAVKKALKQRFTVIQGPPGTGKTVTGAYLVYFLTEQNKLLPNRRDDMRPQILYCGPSNKAVDVITEYLKNFDISIVRVYGKTIEYGEFPVPGLPQMAGKIGSRDVTMDPRHQSISLHHLIRMRHRDDGLEVNSYCDAILGFERSFKTRKPDDSEIKGYLKIIRKAELEELKKYQVVLATCSAAGSRRIKEGTHIKQCIVDEAGMCNEPETLIPLVATKPLQVVLIGDHKQLRPIIPEPTARLLGMDVSLLERYARQMNMLTIQYRMHEAICRFPSMAFYDNRLITPKEVKERPSMFLRGVWPGKGSRPIAFCHCNGVEETLSVKTAEGNEMSKANMYEVQQVVRMVKVLVDVYKISPKEVVVLSQYRLQCDKISTALRACDESDVDVRTVIQSQGSEWNYVLLSTVRSLPRVEIEERPNFGWRKKYLGFITDENQTNVALTRAKHGLIIVGNKHLLRTHKVWKNLIEHYEEADCLVDAHTFLQARQSGRRNRRFQNRSKAK